MLTSSSYISACITAIVLAFLIAFFWRMYYYKRYHEAKKAMEKANKLAEKESLKARSLIARKQFSDQQLTEHKTEIDRLIQGQKKQQYDYDLLQRKYKMQTEKLAKSVTFQEKFETLSQTCEELQQRSDLLNRTLKRLEIDRTSLKQDLDSKANDLSNLKEQVNNLKPFKNKYTLLVPRTESLETEIQELKSQLKTAQNAQDEISEKNRQQRFTIDDLNQQIIDLKQTTQQNLHTQIQELEAQIVLHNKEKQQLHHQIQTLEKETTHHKRFIAAHEATIRQLHHDLKGLSTKEA
ncbi:MAG: hypothetical protein ACPGXL_00515 [Chitinophagales bacterium]